MDCKIIKYLFIKEFFNLFLLKLPNLCP
jgi:hypothetical protein